MKPTTFTKQHSKQEQTWSTSMFCEDSRSDKFESVVWRGI